MTAALGKYTRALDLLTVEIGDEAGSLAALPIWDYIHSKWTGADVASYPDVLKVAGNLGGPKVLKEKVSSISDLQRAVGKGLPFAALRYVLRLFPQRQKTRVQQIVVPRSTLQRREEEGRLRPAESERLERIARLATLAEQVWESSEEAQRFLTTPHPMLEGQAPIELAATDLGTRRVETVLWKLEHSLPV